MSFSENNKSGLIYMSSDKIKETHAFTTRFGGVSKDHLSSLNLGFNRGDDRDNVMENYKRVCSLVGSDVDRCIITCQVHGNEVKIVDSSDIHVWGTEIPYDADGIVTAEKNVPIFCFAADCIPVLLCDSKNKVAGAVHCGWRSSVKDILKNAIDKMISLGAEKECIMVAMGPAIGACCFETDDDVVLAVQEYLSSDISEVVKNKDNGKYLVDLREANRRRLLQLGIPEDNIDVSEECTFCSHDKYWSHRYTKGRRGTQAAVIIMR